MKQISLNKVLRKERPLERLVRKHKALSKKSLAVVWEWAEANDGNPLAEAYMGACGACFRTLNCLAISDILKKNWQGEECGYIVEAYKLNDILFLYRDTVGRIILDMLRRQRITRKII